MVESVPNQLKRTTEQPENPFSALIPTQTIATVPEFTLACGQTIYNVPVAYRTWGRLSPDRDNVMVVCHALSGSADVSDWWGPLMGGDGQALDWSRFYIVCMNILGSPYGTASPVTAKDGDPTKGIYGADFPPTTVQDDVRLVKILLDDLGVKQVPVVIGGSLGGMFALEFAYLGKDYVKTVIPVATSPSHNGWGIAWGVIQRNSILADPKFKEGRYPINDPPSDGLGAARQAALLSYRSSISFQARFGRTRTTTAAKTSEQPKDNVTDPEFRTAKPAGKSDTVPQVNGGPRLHSDQDFAVQSYLNYQRDKFIKRFDANCYLHILNKMDSYDISDHSEEASRAENVNLAGDMTWTRAALAKIQQPSLVLGVNSDILFPFSDQELIAEGIPDSRLKTIESSNGHDGFLLEFDQVNGYILNFLKESLSDIMTRQPTELTEEEKGAINSKDGKVVKESVFGEAEGD